MDAEQQERHRINYSIQALSNGITLHKKRLAVIEKREQRAAAEIARLEKTLADERAERTAVQKTLDDLRATVDVTGRETTHEITKLDREVEAMAFHAYAQEVKKSAPRETRKTSTPVRDPATQRITEVITIDDARPGVATIQVPVRDEQMRIIRTESYECPLVVEDEP